MPFSYATAPWLAFSVQEFAGGSPSSIRTISSSWAWV